MSDDASIGQLLGQLVNDGKRYARAELELAKARATAKVLPLKPAAILAGIGITLALSAVTAMLVGLILSLTPAIGPFGATALVVIGSLIVAGLLLYLAYRQIVGAGR